MNLEHTGGVMEYENKPSRPACQACLEKDDRFGHTCRATSNTLDKKDVVKNPSHYQFFPGVEAIEVIAMSMTDAMFRGYCLGNRLKYRLRAGKKDDPKQELDKSDFYVELYDKHRHLCRPEPGCRWS